MHFTSKICIPISALSLDIINIPILLFIFACVCVCRVCMCVYICVFGGLVCLCADLYACGGQKGIFVSFSDSLSFIPYKTGSLSEPGTHQFSHP